MRTLWCVNITLLVAIGALFSGCQTAGPYTRNGGLAGGLTGGAIGALAGAPEGKALEGALIGAAAGGVIGGALGNSVDHQVAQDRAFYNGVQQQALANAVSINQVVSMSQSGLDDQLIVNQINSNGVARRLTADDLVALKSSGVSNNVISAMQTARPAAGRPGTFGPPRHPGVLVEERWIHPPPVYHYNRPRPRHFVPHHFHHDYRPSWGLSIDL